MSDTSEILNKAADLMQANGWTQGHRGMIVGGPHGYCLEGAICEARGDADQYHSDMVGHEVYGLVQEHPAYQAVCDHLGESSHGWLFLWNDNPRRTQDEVVGVLRAAAVITEARQEAEVSA